MLANPPEHHGVLRSDRISRSAAIGSSRCEVTPSQPRPMIQSPARRFCAGSGHRPGHCLFGHPLHVQRLNPRCPGLEMCTCATYHQPGTAMPGTSILFASPHRPGPASRRARPAPTIPAARDGNALHFGLGRIQSHEAADEYFIGRRLRRLTALQYAEQTARGCAEGSHQFVSIGATFSFGRRAGNPITHDLIRRPAPNMPILPNRLVANSDGA